MSPTWDWNNRLAARFAVWDKEPGTEQRFFEGPDLHGAMREKVIRPKALLTGLLGFDRYGRFQSFHTYESELLNSKRRKEIVALCDKHPEWSEAQAIQALKDSGARYGPAERDAFIKMLPLRQLEPFLGKLTVKDIQFHSLTEEHVGSFVEMFWLVVVAAAPRCDDHEGKEYYLYFDPFSGRLTGVSYVFQ